MDEQNGGTRLSDGYIQCDTFRSSLPFNPFQSYFDYLPRDGVSDPIGDLADTVHVKSDQAEFRDYFRKWFVGILPALLDDTVEPRDPVLIGEQGLAKPPGSTSRYIQLRFIFTA